MRRCSHPHCVFTLSTRPKRSNHPVRNITQASHDHPHPSELFLFSRLLSLHLHFILLLLIIRSFILQVSVKYSLHQDPPDQKVPEQVDQLEQKDGSEDLPLHPPAEPVVVQGVKCRTFGWTDEVELSPDGPKNPDVEVVAEVTAGREIRLEPWIMMLKLQNGHLRPDKDEPRKYRDRPKVRNIVDTLCKLQGL